MTADELDEQLNVAMPGFTQSSGVRAALHDVLFQLMPTVNVRGGLELARPEYGGGRWRGDIELLLLLDNHLLHIKGRLKDGPRQPLSCAHEILPLAGLRKVTVTTNHEEQADGFLMRSARLGLYFSDGSALTAGAGLPEMRLKFVFAFARTVAQALK
jgi:hypothetical protein